MTGLGGGRRRDVDFVVGASAGTAPEPLDDLDEELPAPRRRRPATGSAQRRALGGAAAVLVAAALIARAVSGHDSTSPPAGSPSPSASATVALPAAPVAITAAPGRPLPPQFRPAGCPADATVCAIMHGLPDLALEALRRAFPGAVLSEGVSMLAQRPGRFGPDLVSRAFRAQAGSTEVSVYVSKPDSTGQVSVGNRHHGRISTVTSLRQTVPGFLVNVEVTQPAGKLPVAMDYLVQLANDDGLVAPQ